jgi:hypothetical protein
MSLHALIIMSYRQLRDDHAQFMHGGLAHLIAQECNCLVGEVLEALTNELQRSE